MNKYDTYNFGGLHRTKEEIEANKLEDERTREVRGECVGAECVGAECVGARRLSKTSFRNEFPKACGAPQASSSWALAWGVV